MTLPDQYNAAEREQYWHEYWENHKIYAFHPQEPLYTIDTPPPYVSADHLHIGHAMSYTHTDIISRYKRMRGYNVFYPMGFDDNGLPTERFVEKKYGVNKSKITRSEFIKLCLDETKKGGENYKKLWTRIGISVDWSQLYSSIDQRSREISQRSFIDLHKKGKMELIDAPTTWCMSCQTTLAQADFDNIEKPSTFNDVAFLSEGKELIIATTRPELIPACIALTYHPDDLRYNHLTGKKASVPLFNYDVPIIADKSVAIDKGTGLMMVCTFGDKEDIEKWHRYSLPLRIVFTEYGKMNELAGAYAGLSIKEARLKILEDLKAQGKLKKQEAIVHPVNVHERCGTEVEFLKKRQWQIRVLDAKEELIAIADKIQWYPAFMKVRYEHWVRNLQWNWGISRQRFYGVPFPVWYCAACGAVKLPENHELPLDPRETQPSTPCACGSKKFRPEEDVMDTWMTSSVSPQINSRWGMEGERKGFRPMSLRPQAHDIIRTWAFYTIVKSYYHFNDIPWRAIMISGHGQDSKGQKMSKSKGNMIDPMTVMDQHSADSLRWWAASSKLGEDLAWQEKDITTGKRTVTKLFNAGKFTIQNIQDYDNTPVELELLDKWVLAKLNKTIQECTDTFEEYEPSKARAAADQFFWSTYCDLYLELVKDRIYNFEARGAAGKTAAQYTLYESFLAILKLFAPFVPHITEELYHAHFMKAEEKQSIHQALWPVVNQAWVDLEAEKAGDTLVAILGGVRKYRSEHKLGMKAPLNKLVIFSSSEMRKLIEPGLLDLQAASNVQDIEWQESEGLSWDVR